MWNYLKYAIKYYNKIADEYDTKVSDVKKLVPNKRNKISYTLYYKNLQLYLSLEMKLTKIHKILVSKQSDWMEKYIGFNNDIEKNGKNEFEKSSSN